MPDALLHGIIKPLYISFTFVDTTELVNHAVLAHDCDPVAAHLLGRALTAGSLLTPGLVSGQRVNIQWQYEGCIRNLVVDARFPGHLRAMIQPNQFSSVADNLEQLYGDAGTMQLIRSQSGDIVSSGTTRCAMLDPVLDLSYFLSTSDQVETGMKAVIGLQADPIRPVALSRGFMLQALPECDPIRLDRMRFRLERKPETAALLAQPGHVEDWLERLIRDITSEETGVENIDFEIRERLHPGWKCTCNEEKMKSVLATLPAEEKAAIHASGERLVVRCNFCARRFEIALGD